MKFVTIIFILFTAKLASADSISCNLILGNKQAPLTLTQEDLDNNEYVTSDVGTIGDLGYNVVAYCEDTQCAVDVIFDSSKIEDEWTSESFILLKESDATYSTQFKAYDENGEDKVTYKFSCTYKDAK